MRPAEGCVSVSVPVDVGRVFAARSDVKRQKNVESVPNVLERVTSLIVQPTCLSARIRGTAYTCSCTWWLGGQACGESQLPVLWGRNKILFHVGQFSLIASTFGLNDKTYCGPF